MTEYKFDEQKYHNRGHGGPQLENSQHKLHCNQYHEQSQ